MKKLIFKTSLFLSVPLLIFSGCSSEKFPSSENYDSKIKLSELKLDSETLSVPFGEVKASKTMKILLENDTLSSIDLDIKVSHPFTLQRNRCPSLLEINKSCEINVLVNARGMFEDDSLNSSIFLDGAIGERTIEITGVVKNGITNPATNNEGELELRGDAPTPSNPITNMYIKNIGKGNVSLDQVGINFEDFIIRFDSCSSQIIKPNKECRIQVMLPRNKRDSEKNLNISVPYDIGDGISKILTKEEIDFYATLVKIGLEYPPEQVNSELKNGWRETQVTGKCSAGTPVSAKIMYESDGVEIPMSTFTDVDNIKTTDLCEDGNFFVSLTVGFGIVGLVKVEIQQGEKTIVVGPYYKEAVAISSSSTKVTDFPSNMSFDEPESLSYPLTISCGSFLNLSVSVKNNDTEQIEVGTVECETATSPWYLAPLVGPLFIPDKVTDFELSAFGSYDITITPINQREELEDDLKLVKTFHYLSNEVEEVQISVVDNIITTDSCSNENLSRIWVYLLEPPERLAVGELNCSNLSPLDLTGQNLYEDSKLMAVPFYKNEDPLMHIFGPYFFRNAQD